MKRPRGILHYALRLGILVISSQAYAQGILPSSSEVPISTTSSHIPVLIGEKVPENIILLDSNGTKRTLLSYKAAIEVLVVEFLSPRCEAEQALEPRFQRFYQAYKDWHVAFVAVDLDGVDSVGALQEKFTKSGMNIPVLRDPSGTIQRLLKVTATPEILIMDESGFLRYRGALDDGDPALGKKPHTQYVENAMDAVIGHVEAVSQAEPDGLIGCPLQ